MTPKYASYLHTFFVVSSSTPFIIDCHTPLVSWSMLHWGPDSISPVVLDLPLSQVGHGQTTTLSCARIFQRMLQWHWRNASLLRFSLYFSKDLQHTHVCYLKENSKGSSQIGTTTTTTVAYNNNGNNVQCSTVYNIRKIMYKILKHDMIYNTKYNTI